MELLLYRSYLKYLKDNKIPVSEALKKIPKVMLWILISLILSAICAVVVLCIEQIRQYFFVALGVEAIVSLIVFLYAQHYEIKNSDKDIKAHKKYCEALYIWLEKSLISVESKDIVELKSRMDSRLEKYAETQQRTTDIIMRFIQTLIIPVILTVLTVILNNQIDINVILAYGFVAIMLLCFFIVTLFGFVSFINLIRKNEYEKMNSFSKDLQSILDTQFEDGIFAKIDVKEQK